MHCGSTFFTPYYFLKVHNRVYVTKLNLISILQGILLKNFELKNHKCALKLIVWLKELLSVFKLNVNLS
jgi:hypothetical protein